MQLYNFIFQNFPNLISGYPKTYTYGGQRLFKKKLYGSFKNTKVRFKNILKSNCGGGTSILSGADYLTHVNYVVSLK